MAAVSCRLLSCFIYLALFFPIVFRHFIIPPPPHRCPIFPPNIFPFHFSVPIFPLPPPPPAYPPVITLPNSPSFSVINSIQFYCLFSSIRARWAPLSSTSTPLVMEDLSAVAVPTTTFQASRRYSSETNKHLG